MMKHRSVNLPEILVEEIEQVLNDGKFGYRSRAEFVSEAVRQHLQTLKKTLKKRGNNMSKIEKRFLKELDRIESEHKDDEKIKQAVKRIKDLLK